MKKKRSNLLILFFVASVTLCFAQDPKLTDPVQKTKVLFEQGNQFYAQGNYEEAIKLFEEAIDLNPNLAPLFNNLGLAYRAVGADLEDVAWYFHAAIDIDPQYAESYDNLGKAYYGMGDFDNAESYCKKALELRPNFPVAELSLGWIYLLGRSRPTDAIHHFKNIAEKYNIANAYFGLGLAYFMNGDRTMVLEIITKLREINQDKLATQLEDIFRGHHYVPGTEPPLASLPPSPQEPPGKVVTSGPGEIGLGEIQSSIQPVEGSSRIRLKGKFFNLKEKEYRKRSTTTIHANPHRTTP